MIRTKKGALARNESKLMEFYNKVGLTPFNIKECEPFFKGTSVRNILYYAARISGKYVNTLGDGMFAFAQRPNFTEMYRLFSIQEREYRDKYKANDKKKEVPQSSLFSVICDFSDHELIAEVKRRGMLVGKTETRFVEL